MNGWTLVTQADRDAALGYLEYDPALLFDHERFEADELAEHFARYRIAILALAKKGLGE